MEYLTLKETQTELLKMLMTYDRFCNRHSLRYTLGGGTLLGAVREKGFIPWDDDVDVFMPRPDYEKLKELESDLPSNYRFQKRIQYPFLKIINTNIRAQTEAMVGVSEEYLWIDVFPIDGMPDNRIEIDNFVIKQRNLLRKASWLTVGSNMHGGVKGKIRLLYKSIMHHFKSPTEMYSIIEANATKYDFEVSDNVGLGVWCVYSRPDIMKRSDFDNLIKLKFENADFNAIPSWDENLSILFGDYMVRPPVEDRQTHSMRAWRTPDLD